MLAVLFLILKIIGILLLSILGLLLLTVLILLFVPVRYRIVVKRTGLDGEPPVTAKISVTWLFHMLNIHVVYPSELYVRVRLFIFTLFKIPDAKREQKKQRKDSKKKEDKEEKEKETEETAHSEPDSHGDETEQKDVESFDGEAAETSGKPRKKNILHTIREFCDKIKGIFEQIRDKIIHIRETARSLKDNVAHYRDVMESRAFGDSLHLALGQLAGVLKSIGPKKCRIYIEEGIDDPATTASILAIYGMFYPWLYDKVTVVGNFDEQIIRADVFIKGRITFCRILYAGIRIYFNKQVKSLIRMLKKEDKS